MVIVLLLFGVGKIPALMGDLAKGVKSFKKGLAEDEVVVPPAAEQVAAPADKVPSNA